MPTITQGGQKIYKRGCYIVYECHPHAPASGSVQWMSVVPSKDILWLVITFWENKSSAQIQIQIEIRNTNLTEVEKMRAGFWGDWPTVTDGSSQWRGRGGNTFYGKHKYTNTNTHIHLSHSLLLKQGRVSRLENDDVIFQFLWCLWTKM